MQGRMTSIHQNEHHRMYDEFLPTIQPVLKSAMARRHDNAPFEEYAALGFSI
jgi:hypothetical protein